LVFAPVFVAALWTLAVAAIFDVPFNFANVIVLPLLFGLSVDFGIHLVMRARDAEIADNGTVINPMRTSTPRAVLMSALTTIGSFGSIMLSGHPGTASMGQLLSIAISLSLLAVLVLLPAMLTLSARWQRGP
jgi:predicted RND superfamily exporter protein